MRFSLLDLLLPRETKFFGLLEQMSELLVVSTRTFHDLVVQIETLNADEINKRLLTIKDCDSRATGGSDPRRARLDVITPIDRYGISRLTIQIDKGPDISTAFGA
jgi:hypothetical protein